MRVDLIRLYFTVIHCTVLYLSCCMHSVALFSLFVSLVCPTSLHASFLHFSVYNNIGDKCVEESWEQCWRVMQMVMQRDHPWGRTQVPGS